MRQSDRWVTPAVIVVGLLCSTVVVLGIVGAVAYLSAEGIDPDPMLRLSAEVGAAVSGLASLALQLANRRTTAKVERNTGMLTNAVYDVQDALPRPPRHAYPETRAANMAAAPSPMRGS